MSEPDLIDPMAKLFCSLIFQDHEQALKAEELLEKQFGLIDYHTSEFPFSDSSYYFTEMGSPLFRTFVSFYPLITTEEVAEAKIKSWKIEQELSINNNRTVNLDIGYLDYKRLVLTSFKEQRNKLYAGKGVWSDLIGWVEGQNFKYFDWTFTDYRSGIYDKELMHIRQLFKSQMKEASR